MENRSYPSDLNKREWQTLKPLSQPSRRGRKRKWSTRAVLNAIFYVLKAGCQWRYLPANYCPGKQFSIIFVSGNDGASGSESMKFCAKQHVREQVVTLTHLPRCWTAKASRRPQRERASEVLTVIRKSRGANGTCWSIPWDCSYLFTPPPPTQATAGARKPVWEVEQELWSECSRLITHCVIYYNACLISKLIERSEHDGDDQTVARFRQVSPVV